MSLKLSSLGDNSGSSIFLLLLVIAVLTIVGYRFDRYYVERDYIVNVYTSCDSTVNSCFMADANIADSSFQSGPYEKVEIIARDIPICLEEHTCRDFSCDGLASCKITYCSSESLDGGEACIAASTANIEQ